MSDRNEASIRVEGRRELLLALRRLLRRVFAIRFRYDEALDRQRALALAMMCLIFGLLGMGGTVFLELFTRSTISSIMLITNISLGALYLLMYQQVQTGHLRRASLGFIILALSVPIIENVAFGIIGSEAVYLSLAIPVISAALLLSPRWAILSAALAILAVIGIELAEYQRALMTLGASASAEVLQDLQLSGLVGGFLLAVLALFSWLMIRSLFRWAESAQRRVRQLEAVAVIAESSAVAPNPSALLNVVIERIRDSFGFYHAQVFLIDAEGHMARLEASTGRAGIALLARGHSLRVGSQSMVGQCSFLGSPIVVNDTTLSSVWRPNPLLPDTRAELTVPMLVGENVIGVLDVQSTIPNVFQPEDVRSLEIMAQQLATTLEKTRLVDALQTRATENQRLLEEAQLSLRQVEDLNRRLTREGWSEYLSSRRLGGTLGYTLADKSVLPDTSWTAPMRQAYQGERSVIVRQDQNAHIAAVPLRIRGEVIGVLEVERGGDHPWTDEELNMAETLVDRLALAVENARLYEQATLATEREQAINRIAQDVQSAESIDQILQAALTELGSVLGASRGVVQISPKNEQPTRRGSTGPLSQAGA